MSNLGIKYGLAKSLDIRLRGNFIYNSQRYLNIESKEKSSRHIRFSDITIRLNYQFLADEQYPALVRFLENVFLENNQQKNAYLSSWTLGLTSYRAYDPIVLSLTMGYKYSLQRKINDTNHFKSASLFFFNPQVIFAENDHISLMGGFNFITIGNQKLNHNIIEKKKSLGLYVRYWSRLKR